MKIGIIVFTKTGNTLSVVEKIKEKLAAAGNEAVIEKIELTSGDNDMDAKSISFGPLPDLGTYDSLIFASPVRAFNLAPAMKAYFAKVNEIKSAKTACFVTHHFPYNWMGASGAIAQMKALINARGGDVAATGIVDWSNKKREQQIDGLVEKIYLLYS